ncbi:recombinase family protein [Priestia megaterium]|uniref:recombinase family protein n=1 Tax=Priestia megaterium TaxID=1404 RepID=UPI002E1E190A|nr:recombinase family protein [Priestia megaterium]MED3977280.1 recombinase family protein [Priestia megaterium]
MEINFGYIRVSTNEQNSDRQLEAIEPYVTNEKYIYNDMASGKNMENARAFRICLERQREGIDIAKSKGKHLGRSVVSLPKGWDRLYKEWTAGKITAVAFINEVGMKKATFYNKVKAYEARK